MTLIADLHIHSKYSRATSKQCDLEHLDWWGRRKGIDLIGTGDFTHPAWLAELKAKLVPAEPGLFRLRDEVVGALNGSLAGSCERAVGFVLSVEISSIYKRHGRVRKVHNLVLAPDFALVDQLVARLNRIGNLAADGRPILGLDSHDLLEIVLETGGGCMLIPAHIWTPWFSLFGAKSGFDTIEACFGDLTPHIFALETGLSSDPAMNWQLSALDRFRLVSNSDAHSPAKLGREANLFDTPRDYFEIRRALETGDGFGGTVELFPEEGKYHLDGHRKCDTRLTPEETRACDGRCPGCGKPVTVGVLSRVVELADRPPGFVPERAAPYRCLIPLCEVIGETMGVGPQSKRVVASYDKLLDRIGPELFVLERAPVDAIRSAGGELLAEAIERMRAGEVRCEAGYDGEYGVIRLFRPGELRGRAGTLFALPEPARVEIDTPNRAAPSLAPAAPAVSPALDSGLDDDQLAAVGVVEGPLLVIAGPGTGKTRTLTHRIARLVGQHGVAPSACLAITFTRRAAEEMRRRLAELLPEAAPEVTVTTFHGLGYAILREGAVAAGLPADFTIITPTEAQVGLASCLGISERRAARLLGQISVGKRTGDRPEEGSDLEAARSAYGRLLAERNQVDFDDLLCEAVRLLEDDDERAAALRLRYRFVSIDEYQDIDVLQYRLVRLLVPAGGNLGVIGDPDQAIYSFRGADVGFFGRFTQDFPGARIVELGRNYRSSTNIVDASLQVMAPASLVRDRRLIATVVDPARVTIHGATTDRAEAEFVAHRIERLIGGYGFFSVDSGRVGHGGAADYGFSDIAVLYRTAAQVPLLEEALARAGIPFQSFGHDRLDQQPRISRLLAAFGAGHQTGSVLARLRAAAETLAHDDSDSALASLTPLAERCGGDGARFLSEVAMGCDADGWDPRADRVSLLTLHAAKGLEFAVVFVVGCEEGLLPLIWPGSEPDLAEERRLFFVGMTRAKRCLILSHAKRRQIRGRVRDRQPSIFLHAIAEQLVERSTTRAGGKDRPAKRQLDLF